MAKKSVVSGLAAKLGEKGRKAVEMHRNDDTRFSGGGELPAGIENGIAQLDEFKFSQYKDGDLKGQYFMYASAVVVMPTEHDGIPIKGLRTSIMEPLCDTPNRSRATIEQHLDWILNEMRKLGVDTSELTIDDLEETAAMLKESAPYLRFRTWRSEPTEQYPNPRTNHQWNGIVEDFVPSDDDGDGVVDETGDEDEGEEEETPKAPVKKTPVSKAPAKAATPLKKGVKKVPDEGIEVTDDNLDELAERANEGDAQAAKALVGHAALFNISQEECDAADSWDAVVQMIRDAAESDENGDEDAADEGDDEEAGTDYAALGEAADAGDDDAITALTEAAGEAGIDPDEYGTWSALAEALSATGDEDEGEEEEAEYVPEKGDVVLHTPKGKKKAEEFEVILVDSKKRTVNIKSLDDPKVSLKAVPWDKLETA